MSGFFETIPIGRKIPFLSLVIFLQYPPFIGFKKHSHRHSTVSVSGSEPPGLGPQNSLLSALFLKMVIE